MDGISDCPGEPWETSIPSIRVGTLDTMGMEGECSSDRKEFKPPSCKKIWVDAKASWCLLQNESYYFTINWLVRTSPTSSKETTKKSKPSGWQDVTYLGIDLQKDVCEIYVIDSHRAEALRNNSKISKILFLPWTYIEYRYSLRVFNHNITCQQWKG